MKVAISLPDPVFEAAEQLARHLKKPRSSLYAQAIARFVEAHEAQTITERLNAVYAHTPARLDPVLAAAQLQLLNDEAW
jgi:metal-responsive CopG/Arc/MetJ family transcriptional regulator